MLDPSNHAIVELRTVRDRLDIAQVLSVYAQGWDTRNFELVRSCFVPGAAISYGTLPEFPQGLDDFLALEIGNIQELVSTQHLIANVHISFDGPDTSTCISYVQATHYAANGDNWTTGGRYDDTFVRVDGAWRISARFFTRQWIRDEQGLSRKYLST